MNEKVYEDGTKAAKTPLMIYYAKIYDNILWICSWQDDHQRSVNDFGTSIIGNLRGNQLRPCIFAVLAGVIIKTDSLTLPAPFSNCVSTMIGPVGRVIQKRYGRSYIYSKYWLPAWGKKIATCSVPLQENGRQLSVNHFWPFIIGNQCSMHLLLCIYDVLTVFLV